MGQLAYYKMITDKNGKRVPKWKPRKIKCNCGKEFIDRNPSKKYCSMACQKIGYNQRRRRSEHHT